MVQTLKRSSCLNKDIYLISAFLNSFMAVIEKWMQLNVLDAWRGHTRFLFTGSVQNNVRYSEDHSPLWWLRMEEQTPRWTNRGTATKQPKVKKLQEFLTHRLLWINKPTLGVWRKDKVIYSEGGLDRLFVPSLDKTININYKNLQSLVFLRPFAGSSTLSGRSRPALGSALRPVASCAATGRVWCLWKLECCQGYRWSLPLRVCTSEQWRRQKK